MGRKRKCNEGRSHLEEERGWSLETPLAILLLHKFCWGKLSACDVQMLAEAAQKSGAKGQDLACLARLGANGLSKNNCHRDLVRNFFKDKASPKPSQVETLLNVKDAHGAIVKSKKEAPLLLPHDWVQCLEEQQLLEALTCSKEALQNFWKKQDWRHNPQLQCWKKFWKDLDLDGPGTLD